MSKLSRFAKKRQTVIMELSLVAGDQLVSVPVRLSAAGVDKRTARVYPQTHGTYSLLHLLRTLKTKTYTAREKPLVFDYPSLHSLPHLPSKDWRPRRRHPEDTVPQQTESQYFGDES